MNTLPQELRGFFEITEIDSADFFVSKLFRKKFGHLVPDFPRHFAAFYRSNDGASYLVGYSHMRRLGAVYLSGGSCTEGDALRRMSQTELSLLKAHGGVWFQLLKYKFAKLSNECEAFFGHCGDARALEVALEAGFVKLAPQHLIAHWHRPISAARMQELIDEVHAIGPF